MHLPYAIPGRKFKTGDLIYRNKDDIHRYTYGHFAGLSISKFCDFIFD